MPGLPGLPGWGAGAAITEPLEGGREGGSAIPWPGETLGFSEGLTLGRAMPEAGLSWGERIP